MGLTIPRTRESSRKMGTVKLFEELILSLSSPYKFLNILVLSQFTADSFYLG